jgi:hypothetical protein
MNEAIADITDIADDELKQVTGGGFWDVVSNILIPLPVQILLDNWVNPDKAGDLPPDFTGWGTAGSSGGDETTSSGGGREGPTGSSGG